MASDDLDDLFRQQLGGHATPPGADLQRRLAELAEAERLDTLFRTGLGSHASQPRRAVWERLDDEHLHPQPRRRRPVAAWWQLSAAAVLLLTLLAGGLWCGGLPGPHSGGVATHRASGGPAPAAPAAWTKTPGQRAPRAGAVAARTTAPWRATAPTLAAGEKKQEIFSGQATASALTASSHPIASITRPRHAAATPRVSAGPRNPSRQPDAAAGTLAATGGRHAPAGRLSPVSPKAAATTVAPAPREASTLAAVATMAAAPPDVIEVEVRRGPAPGQAVAPASVAATAPAEARRPRLRLGDLLRQADHLVHGEPVRLAEATGLAETVTVQARLGGRTLSKTIQL